MSSFTVSYFNVGVNFESNGAVLCSIVAEFSVIVTLSDVSYRMFVNTKSMALRPLWQ